MVLTCGWDLYRLAVKVGPLEAEGGLGEDGDERVLVE
jgi:hypothetical protein